MREGYTHIAVVLDRSGSMGSCKSVTIEGLNSFINKQKMVKGEGTITLVQFDDCYEVNYDFLPLENTPLLTDSSYVPRGMTALLDAIGRTIDETGAKLAALPENKRPARVIIVIQTDGLENSSTKYISPPSSFDINVRSFQHIQSYDKGARVREMIKHQQEKYNWDFVFLGAGQDAIATAINYGINAKSAMTYDTDNSVQAFNSVSNYTSSYRSAPNMRSAKLCSFSDEDRENAVDASTTSNVSSSKKKGHTSSKVS